MTRLQKAIREMLICLGNKNVVKKFDKIEKGFKKKKVGKK